MNQHFSLDYHLYKLAHYWIYNKLKELPLHIKNKFVRDDLCVHFEFNNICSFWEKYKIPFSIEPSVKCQALQWPPYWISFAQSSKLDSGLVPEASNSAWNESQPLAGLNFFFWASKKLVTGSNGIMVAQTFYDIFFMKKRHQISIYKQFSD